MAEYERLKKAAEKAGQHSDEAINKAKEVVSQITEEVTSRGADLAEQVKERGGELLDEAKDRGEEAIAGISRWAKKNPGAAVAAGVIVGIALATFFSREKD